MIKEITRFVITCTGCDILYPDTAAVDLFNTEEEARHAFEVDPEDWIEIEGKHFCYFCFCACIKCEQYFPVYELDHLLTCKDCGGFNEEIEVIDS